jgi:hypothetical protein
MPYIDDPGTLSEPLTSLDLEVTTVNAAEAESFSRLFVNVVFTDGTRLYEPFNHEVTTIGFPPTLPLPQEGESRTFPLPIPAHVSRTLGEVAEVFVRKSGADGWFVGSVLLFANGHAEPLIGNRHCNQFLDSNDDVLLLREWSTASFCVAPAVEPKHPLPSSGYRVLGPVLGQVSSSSAVVLYRVDREGRYRFRVSDAESGTVVSAQEATLEPTGRFTITGLQPDHRYAFDLRLVRAGVELPVPGAAGHLQTYPAEGSRGVFCIAFGSCANPDEQAAQGCWTGIRSLAEHPPEGIEPVKLLVHLGDTFYFYDHMTGETVTNRESMLAAHVSQRRHLEFLDMARVVPCCAVWDDHDFAGNGSDGTDLDPSLKLVAKEVWLQYWGNDQPTRLQEFGLSTLISHGLVDMYLLDGRFSRDKEAGVCFGQAQITEILRMIRERGAAGPRLVVLASGSNWNHMHTGETENYGHEHYDQERETFYRALADLMGSRINGLLLLSGDTHRNEIYSVALGNGRSAPEFVSSPFTNNTSLMDESAPTVGERLASFPTKGVNGRRGFATLTLDTMPETGGNWTATVRYYEEAGAGEYESRSFVVENGGFVPLA